MNFLCGFYAQTMTALKKDMNNKINLAFFLILTDTVPPPSTHTKEQHTQKWTVKVKASRQCVWKLVQTLHNFFGQII